MNTLARLIASAPPETVSDPELRWYVRLLVVIGVVVLIGWVISIIAPPEGRRIVWICTAVLALLIVLRKFELI